MAKMSIQELIDLHKDLEDAIFFNGANEFFSTGKYTDTEWIDKANLFLNGYQEVVKTNTTVAKHHYFLCEKDDSLIAEYQSRGIFLADIDLTDNNRPPDLDPEVLGLPAMPAG